MIIKNPSAAVKRMDSYVPKWNSDGQKTVKAVALVATTAMVPMKMVLTDSGYGLAMIADVAPGKLGIPLTAGASGDYIETAVEGYLEGVHCCSSAGAGSCTAHSTYVKGDYVFMSDTGVIAAGNATWLSTFFMQSTVGGTGYAAMGVALSSGETATLNMWLYERSYYSSADT